jgi:pilus assembly protein CpaF
MRFPGFPEHGALRGGVVHSPAEAGIAESDAASTTSGIFPPARADNRARQLEETWLLLFRELRGPVDTTLLGGLSAGDVAYRLGELVHNYFRTRGVTLASYELRRIVVELLDNHKRGWPTLKPAPGPSAPPSSLVDFVDGDPDARALRHAAALPPELGGAAPAASPTVEAIPSPLVDVRPREQAATTASPAIETAGPSRSARPTPRRRPMPDLSPPHERTGTLTPEQIANMEAAAADAANAVFGGEQATPPEPPASVSVESGPVGPGAVDSGPAVSDELSAEAAMVAIAAAWGRRRGAAPPPAARDALGLWVSETTAQALADSNVRIGTAERARLEQLILDDAFGLGPIEPLLRDAALTSIMVNGPHAVFVERRGQIERVGGFRDAAHLAAVLDRLARFAGKPMSGASSLVVEGRLPDASRFVIVSPPLAPSGPICTITRRAAPVATLDDLVGQNALSQPMANLLRAASRGRLNILVSGRAESGRTTMLSALARAVTPGERVVTVERRPELRLDLANVVSLVAPETGPEMIPAIDLSLAIAAASRMRPDRLVIDGLGNGAVAALVTLIDNGRDGVVASCEAAAPRAALEELARRIVEKEPQETPATAQRRLAAAFDLVVHVEASRDGTVRVTHIAEIAGADDEGAASRDLYFYDRDSRNFVGAGLRPAFLPRLARLGVDQAVLDAI